MLKFECKKDKHIQIYDFLIFFSRNEGRFYFLGKWTEKFVSLSLESVPFEQDKRDRIIFEHGKSLVVRTAIKILSRL